MKKLKICSYWKIFSEFYVLTCKIVAILRKLGIDPLWIYKKSQNLSKNLGIKPDLAKIDPDEQIWAEKCLIWKDAFFQKNQLGIGPIRRKSEESGQKWILEPLFSKI